MKQAPTTHTAMKTKAHTPGPWNVLPANGHDRTYRTITKNFGPHTHSIAEINSSPEASCDEEQNANACLIAAAPNMLKALEMVESCLAPDDNDPAAVAVRIAIKQATGWKVCFPYEPIGDMTPALVKGGEYHYLDGRR